jgi:predicted RNA binding protein YcfA (HicA-like mRNA interferase family)
MPPMGPISRGKLIRSLRKLDFRGPFSGGKHEVMQKGTNKVVLPNPHEGDIGVGLLARILRQAGITRDEWENL